MSKPKRFGIDIDGTITTQDSMLPYINKAFRLQLTLEDINQYEFYPFVNVPEHEFDLWFQKHEPIIYSESPMAKDAKQVLQEWKEVYELYFISARNQTLLPVTKEWFSKNDLLYHHIELIGTHNKIATVKKHQIDLFFEDKHDNAVAIAEECEIPVILFDAPYNRMSIPNNVIRVDNWMEAYQWVNHWIKENE
jgi:uncharacterized protein